MIPSVRARRRALRISRQGPFLSGDDFTTAVYDADGEIKHYRCNPRPAYVCRAGWRTKRAVERDILAFRMWDVDHDLGPCCGWGMSEHGEMKYPWRAEEKT